MNQNVLGPMPLHMQRSIRYGHRSLFRKSRKKDPDGLLRCVGALHHVAGHILGVLGQGRQIEFATANPEVALARYVDDEGPEFVVAKEREVGFDAHARDLIAFATSFACGSAAKLLYNPDAGLRSAVHDYGAMETAAEELIRRGVCDDSSALKDAVWEASCRYVLHPDISPMIGTLATALGGMGGDEDWYHSPDGVNQAMIVKLLGAEAVAAAVLIFRVCIEESFRNRGLGSLLN